MRIRLGYVAIALNLDKVTSSSILTYSRYLKLPPKIHFSSPRDFKNDRKHSDFIDAKKFLEFIYDAKESVNKDFDL